LCARERAPKGEQLQCLKERGSEEWVLGIPFERGYQCVCRSTVIRGSNGG
jgi:hypothetical protein